MAGRRFAVPTEGGLRLGRSSSCEISAPDPALSRNHCLFEQKEGAIWITDLASANGTMVNEKPLGAESCQLAVGDTISAGGIVLQVVGDGPDPATKVVDLGLEGSGSGTDAVQQSKGLGRGVLWSIAAAAVLIAAVLIFAVPSPEAKDQSVATIQTASDDTLIGVSFERVDATTSGIYRYSLEYSTDGSLSVEYANVPDENRHFKRTEKLSMAARQRLSKIFSGDSLYELEPEYCGSGVSAGVLNSRRLKVIRGGRVFETYVENTDPPSALRDVCEQLEAFSKNELSAWALQYPVEKLKEMSVEAVRAADAKWNERDVQYGNLSAAIKLYDEAVVYLETVNPKPEGYDELLSKRITAKKELDRRYSDQRFLVDRAMNMGDWETARRELRILCEMVPDERDSRHTEASAKLIDVEERQKKGNAQ